MNTSRVKFAIFTVFLALASQLRAAGGDGDEGQQIAILLSPASVTEKAAACQQLRVSGTAQAVPILAGLLSDPQLSQLARHALEAIPALAAGAALREALARTSGSVRAGVVSSLGIRRDEEAVALLCPLLADPDGSVASSAAAFALGGIGGPQAVASLASAVNTTAEPVRTVILESLIRCAERLLSGGDAAGAAAVVRDVRTANPPPQMGAAVWRIEVLADAEHRAEQVTKALAGEDVPLRVMSQRLIREMDNSQVTLACTAGLPSLPAGSQVALIEACARLGKEAFPVVQRASGSPDVSVRMAAWEVLGSLGDPRAIPALVSAAAGRDAAEVYAARAALTRLSGPGLGEALLAHLDSPELTGKAELLRALGERGDAAVAPAVVRFAAAESEAVRLAALESLAQLAAASTVRPLLDLEAAAKSKAEGEAARRALLVVCRSTLDKEQATREVVDALGRLPAEGRRGLLALLPELATPDALAAAQAASRNADVEMAREPGLAKRVVWLRQAMGLARRHEEKRQVLSLLGQIPLPEALALVQETADPALAGEVALAAASIAGKLSPLTTGKDRLPIPGLTVERLSGAAHPATSTPPEATLAKPAVLPPRDAFQKLRLSEQFLAEGADSADFNRDGKADVVTGPYWFEGPEFQKRHEYRPAKVYDSKGYSDNFLTYCGDFNGDGWTDLLCVPMPGTQAFWYENPRGMEIAWSKYLAYSFVGNESPVWGDVDGDGRPELIFNNDGYLGYAGPNPAKPAAPWVFHAVSGKEKRYQRFTHGIGYGDLNGDRRVDLVEAAGWWEQPETRVAGKPWIFHPHAFAQAGAQMLVNDVDGDGLADVITAWHCHLYGLVWWRQQKGADGRREWKQQVVLSPTPDLGSTDFRPSQMHALELVDMNGDGLLDVLTGKRFWAHGPNGDKEPDAPAVLFWLEVRRPGPGKAEFVPHLIDDDSGVGTQVTAADLNGDHRPDVVVANKKGIFIHFNQRP